MDRPVDRIAIVTGAGSGIGRAVSLALMGEGYALVLAGRRTAPLEAVAQEGKDQEGKDQEGEGQEGEDQRARTLVVPTDVGDPQAVRALFAKTKERFGRLDLLFNNAGTGMSSTSFEDLTYEQWTSVVNTNLTGTFLCTQEAFRMMKRQRPRGGRIINNGSISAHTPRPNSAPYTSTKHAITGLTKSTSLDGRQYDIACGQIDIGNAVTDMTEQMAEGLPQANGMVAPEPRMDLRHVADAVIYMASLPLDANVQFLTVLATKMPFIGRG